MAFRQSANGRRTGNFRMRREKLGLELFQEGLSFLLYLLLDYGIVGRGFGSCLHLGNDRGRAGRNPLFAVAGRARVEVGRIIETAIGTRQAETGGLVRRL